MFYISVTAKVSPWSILKISQLTKCKSCWLDRVCASQAKVIIALDLDSKVKGVIISNWPCIYKYIL